MLLDQTDDQIDDDGEDHRPEEVLDKGVAQGCAPDGRIGDGGVGHLEGHADGEYAKSA